MSMAKPAQQFEAPNASANAGPTTSNFPAFRICIILTVAAAAVWAAGLLIFPGVLGDSGTVIPPLNAAALLVWGLTMISIALIGIASPFGIKAFAAAFMITIFVRMLGVFIGARILIYKEILETGKPLAASLALMYLPLLAIEVAIMARHLKSQGLLAVPNQSETAKKTGISDDLDDAQTSIVSTKTTSTPQTDPCQNTGNTEVNA
jgi:hypothetical protein